MDASELLVLFLFMVVGGVLLEVVFSKIYFHLTRKHYKKHHYSLGKYLFLLTMPIIALILVTYWQGITIPKIFFIFALLGPTLEWTVGFSYYMIVGERLWTYHRYAINKHTSLLSIPFWGLAGVLFLLLAKTL